MTYSSGGTIAATDYNTRATSVNAVWGTGSGDSGYGQSTTLPSVSTSGTVAASNWASMIARLDSLRAHQSSTTSGISQPAAGNTITFLSGLDTQISTVTSNRLVRATTGTVVTYGNSQLTNTGTWYTQSLQQVHFSWPSYDQMRYYFNAGGYIQASMGISGPSTTKGAYWNDHLVNRVGIFYVGSNYCGHTGTGSSNVSVALTGGFWSMTGTYQLWRRIYSYSDATTIAGGYVNNYVDIYLYTTGASVYMYWQLNDVAPDSFNDQINGTLYMNTNGYPPETTYLSNTWGTSTCTTDTNTVA